MFKQNLTKKSSKNQIIRFLSLTGNDKQRRKIFVQTKKKKIGNNKQTKKRNFFFKQKNIYSKKNKKIFTQKNKTKNFKKNEKKFFSKKQKTDNPFFVSKWPKWPKPQMA